MFFKSFQVASWVIQVISRCFVFFLFFFFSKDINGYNKVMFWSDVAVKTNLVCSEAFLEATFFFVEFSSCLKAKHHFGA